MVHNVVYGSRQDACDHMALLLAAEQRVSEGSMTSVKYNSLSMVVGLNANADGLLADKELAEAIDAIGSVTYDWVHNSFQDGTFTVEARPSLQESPPRCKHFTIGGAPP